MYTINERVSPSRTNGEGYLKLVSAIDMMQDCSQLWMESEPVFRDYFESNNASQLLASRQIDILRTPTYGERLTITTSVFDCQHIQGYRNTFIYDEAGEPCIKSWSTGAFVSLDTGRLFRIPEEVSGSVVIDPQLEMEYLERKIVLPTETGAAAAHAPVRVRRNDIDLNRHMNNARYVEIAVELFPENFNPKRLRLEYKTPATCGENLHPKVAELDDKIYITLENEAGRPCAIMEFC